MSGSMPSRAFSSPSKITSQNLQKELQSAVNSALGSGTVTPYKKVVVVLIHFEHDNIGVVPLENDLVATFREFYGITDFRRVELPRPANPEWVLQQALIQLITAGYTEKNCLIILVFSGHGESVHTASDGVRADSYSLHLK